MKLHLAESTPGELDALTAGERRELALDTLAKAMGRMGYKDTAARLRPPMRGGELAVVAELAGSMTAAYDTTMARLADKLEALAGA